ATLTIMPGVNQWMGYGSAVPTLAYNANGFVNNDTYAALSGALGTSATSTSPVGTYTFNLGTLSASNYTLALATYLPTFAVTPVWPPLKVSDASGPYTQKPFTATATVTGVNGVAGASLENVTPTLTYYDSTGTQMAVVPFLPGSYSVKAAFAGSTDYVAAST